MERSTIHLLAKRGKSQRTIARELQLSRVTVARALAEPVDKTPAKRQRTSIVDPYREQIRKWVQEGLTAVRMLELVRAEPAQPYRGSRSVFGEAVRRVRLEVGQAAADVPVRFEGLPGEYLQVDWGEVRNFPFTEQRSATRYFLACRLKYSRLSWVWWTSDMREETLIRGLVACFCRLGWVPWVLVFDNMKTVTSGRDAEDQPIWHPVLLSLAKEFDFHPEACAVGAANQKGSVESLVKWVKGNFLAGRSFADDRDLERQNEDWLAAVNGRPSSATGEPPVARLEAEAAKGGKLPPTAADYGFPESGQVTDGSVVHVAGNAYSVPLEHRGAPVTVRRHQERVRIWRGLACIADHRRAPDGAHQRVIDPTHFTPLFARKPRAQVMLYREALLALGGPAFAYVSELSRRRRERLGEEILAVYALFASHGADRLLTAMEQADRLGVYGADYLGRLLSAPPATPDGTLRFPNLPRQAEIDRLLSSYEAAVTVDAPLADGEEPAVAEVTR